MTPSAWGQEDVAMLVSRHEIAAPEDVFAVGEDGAILHYDGTEWTLMTPTDRTLLGIWSSSGSDAFAVGNGGIILHGTP